MMHFKYADNKEQYEEIQQKTVSVQQAAADTR
jgi:hypothetical protein